LTRWMCGKYYDEDDDYDYNKLSRMCIRENKHRGVHIYGTVCSNMTSVCDIFRIWHINTHTMYLTRSIRKEEIDLLEIVRKMYKNGCNCHKDKDCSFDIDKFMEKYEKEEES